MHQTAPQHLHLGSNGLKSVAKSSEDFSPLTTLTTLDLSRNSIQVTLSLSSSSSLQDQKTPILWSPKSRYEYSILGSAHICLCRPAPAHPPQPLPQPGEILSITNTVTTTIMLMTTMIMTTTTMIMTAMIVTTTTISSCTQSPPEPSSSPLSK